jgi:hypothetical protein
MFEFNFGLPVGSKAVNSALKIAPGPEVMIF